MSVKGEATIDLQTLLSMVERDTSRSEDSVRSILSASYEDRYKGYTCLHRTLTRLQGDEKALKEQASLYVPLLAGTLLGLTRGENAKPRSLEVLTVVNLLGLFPPREAALPLGNLRLEALSLSAFRLDFADLRRTIFTDMRLISGTIREADLTRASFEGGLLRNVSLNRALGRQVKFDSVSFDQGEAVDARFNDSIFSECEFNGTDLSKIVFAACDLAGTTFTQCKLGKADFSHGSLYGVRISGSDLAGASFHNADLRGADLRDARNLKASQLESAIVGTDTRLPDNIR